jgi:hypothetical protein
MKKRITVCFVVSLLLIPGLAVAVEEKEPQQLVVFQEFAVHPEGIAKFEASLKALHGPATEHGLDYGWDVYASDDMRYTITFWVDGLAGLEATSKKWMAFADLWGKENFADWNHDLDATLKHTKVSLWYPRPDLSYLPENQPEGDDFFFWGTIFVKPGHMEAVEEGFKKFAQLMTEHEVPGGWRTAVGGLGTEGPVIGYLEWGASAGAFFTRADVVESNEELMKATAPVWEKMLPHIRGYEYVTGKYRKDLSWHPEKKAE